MAVRAATTSGAEGWRYLSRLTRLGLEMMVEHADPDFPRFYYSNSTTLKMGGDNPDNQVCNATVSGNRRYRIWGKRGTARDVVARTDRPIVDACGRICRYT